MGARGLRFRATGVGGDVVGVGVFAVLLKEDIDIRTVRVENWRFRIVAY